jgi:hypothetical protein
MKKIILTMCFALIIIMQLLPEDLQTGIILDDNILANPSERIIYIANVVSNELTTATTEFIYEIVEHLTVAQRELLKKATTINET